MADIIPCTPNDVDALVAVARETFIQTFALHNTADDMERYLSAELTRDKLASQLDAAESFFYLIVHDSEAGGYLKLNVGEAQSDVHDPDAMEVERIYLLQRCQGLGLADAMMEFTVEKARELGKTYIWLGVWEHNRRAIRFYEKQGFHPFDTHCFQFGSDSQTDILMRRDL